MTLKIAFQQLSTISGSISKCRMQNFCVSSTKTPSPESQRNLYQMKNTKNRTVMPPPTANHVVEFSVAASFLYLADIIERFCDLLSNSVKKIAIYYTFCCPSISHISHAPGSVIGKQNTGANVVQQLTDQHRQATAVQHCFPCSIFLSLILVHARCD